MINIPSIHYNERKLPISMLIFHCSTLGAKEMIKVLDEDKLSAHYIIGFDGEIIKQVDEEKRAWHAGVSSWKGISDVNSASIGIEISNKTLGQSEYDEKQIKSIIVLSQEIIKRHNIKPQNIIGHSDIAPTRKPDPGFCFPWERLAKNNIGLWYSDEKLSEIDPKKLLEIIGYNTENTIASAYAFARHWLPKLINIKQEIAYLIENIYPKNDDKILHNPEFINTLQTVAYQFKKIS